MTRTGTLLAVAAVSLAIAAAAHVTAQAADVPGYGPPPDEGRALRPIEDRSTWYLRGDVGYRWQTLSRAIGEGGFPTPSDNSFGGAFAGGIGAGFKTGALRLDLTLDHGMAARYSGTGPDGSVSAKVQSTSGLFNAYYDLAAWSSVTPYIGAGIGIAYLRISDIQSGAMPLTPSPDASRWNLAWAAMAGASFQFTPSLAVDTGYRLLGLGSAENETSATGKLALKGITAHEFRVGLRWSYDSVAGGAR